MRKAPKDPADNVYYTYTISSDKKKYQLLAMLELEEMLRYGMIVEKAYAVDYSDRYPKVI
jgi:hypothetical protein